MSGLVELLLHIEPAVSGQHHVDATLRERPSHPPRFRVTQGQVEEVEPWSFGAEGVEHRNAKGFILAFSGPCWER
ncbi:MAG TPA: hypothetical protein VF794_32120 [Archangium sp.]|jgi:hypothetical protein